MINQAALEQILEQWNIRIQTQPQDWRAFIQRGMVNFKLARIAASIEDFDQAERLYPEITPYLWQRGLSYYYADRWDEGARQFEVDLQVNAQDVEETVWRYLCIARLYGSQEARASFLPVKHDPRPVLRAVYDLFAGQSAPADILSLGKQEGNRGLFYSHLYVGLYYEAENQGEQARTHIVKAVADYPLEDYMWYLAWVHTQLREWQYRL